VTDKELLAVIKSVEHFRHYLLGKSFTLRTDHKALQYMWSTTNPSSKLLRWSLKLQEYSFTPEYIKGEKNVADGLSRQGGIIVANISERPNSQERQNIISQYHLLSGHGSSNTLKFMIRSRYKWPAMVKEIEDYVKSCEVCLKSGTQRVNTKNRIIEVHRPNELWEIDLIGRIVDKSNESKFILVAIDHYTKWIETAILKSKDGKSVANWVEKLIIKKHGVPAKILSDNGLEFSNQVITELKNKYNFEWAYCSPGHHKTV
jgi:hypothetical protein